MIFFIKYVVFCEPMALVSFIVFTLSSILIARLFYLHCASRHIKKKPISLKKSPYCITIMPYLYYSWDHRPDYNSNTWQPGDISGAISAPNS